MFDCFQVLLVAQFLVNFCFALLKQLALRYNFLTSCSLETRSVIWPGKLSEVLLKRPCSCVFKIVPSRKSPHLRQLVEGRDKQSIPHYSVCPLFAPSTWLKHWDKYPRSNRVNNVERVPTFWTPTLSLMLSLIWDRSNEAHPSFPIHLLHLSPSMARLRATFTHYSGLSKSNPLVWAPIVWL